MGYPQDIHLNILSICNFAYSRSACLLNFPIELVEIGDVLDGFKI